MKRQCIRLKMAKVQIHVNDFEEPNQQMQTPCFSVLHISRFVFAMAMAVEVCIAKSRILLAFRQKRRHI